MKGSSTIEIRQMDLGFSPNLGAEAWFTVQLLNLYIEKNTSEL